MRTNAFYKVEWRGLRVCSYVAFMVVAGTILRTGFHDCAALSLTPSSRAYWRYQDHSTGSWCSRVRRIPPRSCCSDSVFHPISPKRIEQSSCSFFHQRHSDFLVLTTTARDGDASEKVKSNPWKKAVAKFKARPVTYLLIPCVAAVVGWFTNWLAVQMIFYPIGFAGIPIYRRPEIPLGLLGWQGIVPCKTRPMTEAIVNMVTSQLLTVKEAFGRCDPKVVANVLAPEIPILAQDIIHEVVPLHWLRDLPTAVFSGLDGISQSILRHWNVQFLQQFTKAMQSNIDNIFDLKSCVVQQMMQDRSKLGQLFRTCGQRELDFLTNSGLWFGFLLGIVQLFVALFWENPWTLSIGGGIVGLATNWLALKWIFEPVNPTRVGPFVLQGMFLRRQKDVAVEFSKFFAQNILTAQNMFQSVLNDPNTRPAFASMFKEHFEGFVGRITRGFRINVEPETMNLVTRKALEKLPSHLPVVYPYIDSAMNLQETLRIKMEQMSSAQFERVLHPIFEEDEFTLILAGAVLGFAAGLVQQGLETGVIKVPDLWTPVRYNVAQLVKTPRLHFQHLLSQMRSSARSARTRIIKTWTSGKRSRSKTQLSHNDDQNQLETIMPIISQIPCEDPELPHGALTSSDAGHPNSLNKEPSSPRKKDAGGNLSSGVEPASDKNNNDDEGVVKQNNDVVP